MVNPGSDIGFSKYIRDGSGRDSYIGDNNGNFFRNYYEPARGLIYGGKQLKTNMTLKPNEHKKEFSSGKHSNYSPDGSGRDGYIHGSNGGLYP